MKKSRLTTTIPMTRTTLVAAVLAAAITAAAFVFNPSPEQHRTKIKEAIAERNPLSGALGLGVLAAFTSTYHPLGVASYTTVNGRTVSIGAFGLVFVVDSSPALLPQQSNRH